MTPEEVKVAFEKSHGSDTMTPYTAYRHALNNHIKPDFDLKHYQEIACKAPIRAYLFAQQIPGADIEYCQEHACKDPLFATLFFKDIPGADLEYCRKACRLSGYGDYWNDILDKIIAKNGYVMTPGETLIYARKSYTEPDFDLEHYQEIVCKDPGSAYNFAAEIPGANIEYCQEHACKDSRYAYGFAKYVQGADIEYCQEHACKDPEFAHRFATFILGADIEYCRKACEHDKEWLDKFDKMIARKGHVMTPLEAYNYACSNYINPDFDLNYYQEIACKNPGSACDFARNIPGANIEYCQKHACKDAYIAYYFARNVSNADIEYCRRACEHDEYWLNEFDKMIIKRVML